MVPGSADNKVTNDSAHSISKQRKSMIGRIKTKLSTTIGRKRSPTVAISTPKDMIKGTMNFDGDPQKEAQENNREEKSSCYENPEVEEVVDAMSEADYSSDDYPKDSASLCSDLVSAGYINDAMVGYEQQWSELPEQLNGDDDDKKDEMEGEVIASHFEAIETHCNSVEQPGKELHEPHEMENDDDILEVFHSSDDEGSQRLVVPGGNPEDDDGGCRVGCHDDEADESNIRLPEPQNVDLVIIGVTPFSRRNRCVTRKESEESLHAETTPQIVCERLSYPIKPMRPRSVAKAVTPSRGSNSKGSIYQPHRHIQEAAESNVIEYEQAYVPLERLSGRSDTIETPSLCTDSDPVCYDNKEVEEPRTDKKDGTEDAGSVDSGVLITCAFGERIVSLLAADRWDDRQDGFDAIKNVVRDADVPMADPSVRLHLLCASLAAVQCGVEDRVVPVVLCALQCLCIVLKEFSRALPDDRAFADTEPKIAALLNNTLSALVGALVRKVSDLNKRIEREATEALVGIARVRSLRALPHLLLHLNGRAVSPRRQLELLRRILNVLGLSTSAESSTQTQHLTQETVLQFVVPALQIADEKTRDAAVEILADLQKYTNNSTAWHTYLTRALKPETLRVIICRVEELSSIQQQATKTGATNQAEERPDDEVEISPAELVGVPQQDDQSSLMLLEASLLKSQDMLGPVCWRKLSSKTWSDRKEALLDVEKAITEAKSDLRDARPAFGSVTQSTFVAYCAVIYQALGDSIAPVVNTALETYATLVKIFGVYVEWREAAVRELTLLTLLRLFGAMQKSNTRTTRAACRGVLKLARLPCAHPLRYVLSCLFGGEGSSVCDPQVQMHLLRLLVPEFGFQADGLGASRVMEAVRKGLTDNSSRLRRSAADVALCAQRLLGRDFVLARLEGVKSATLKELEKSFVDGIGGSTERPQTVHGSDVRMSAAIDDDSNMPYVICAGSGELSSRRLLNSAPVGIGRLQYTSEHDMVSSNPSPRTRALVLSNDEENLMNSILGADDPPTTVSK